MTFDYIEAVMNLNKDKPSLDYLDYQACYKTGWEKYLYEGCRAVEIWINSESRKFVLKGSIPYFFAGQNFRSSSEDFKSGIEHLSEVLSLDLGRAEMKAFEYGTTLEIPFPVREVLLSHIRIPGMKAKFYDYGVYFEDRALKVKLYDAGKNLKVKLTKEEREILTLFYGYNPIHNYLRIENHYKNPSVCFKKSIVSMSDLFKSDFENSCKIDLSEKYNSIMKTKAIRLRSKKQLTSSTIPLIILKEYEGLLPCKAEDLIKQKIKALPSDILTNDDRKSRRRQIASNFRKLKSERPCKYDVSGLLKNQAFR